MATSVYTNPAGWHEGESQMHRLLRVPEYDNPSSFGLNPYATHLLHLSSILAVGTLDGEGRPWTTLIGGKPGFVKSLGDSVVGVKTVVGWKYDPVLEALVSEDGRGKALSALGIHLDTRDRVKLSGRLLGSGLVGSIGPTSDKSELQKRDAVELQMAFAVEQSLGNCPKYLNRKSLLPVVPQPTLLSDSLPLGSAAIALLSKADTFFISTSHHTTNMGTNHRGGPPGFVRLASNGPQRTTLIYPEYSGNRLYQTLGNLYTTPRAGLVFPDFSTGDVLYMTGTTEITYGKEASEVLPRSNLLVKIHLTAAKYVQRGLAFRAAGGGGGGGEPSPYNPPVRYLASERAAASALTVNANDNSRVSATLIAKEILTPTIARFRFRLSISDPRAASRGTWKAGQYVALAFGDELDVGYSHMRDDDPRSLNDDFVRTFTVSSPSPLPPAPAPAPAPPPPATAAAIGTETTKGGAAKKDEFEITIRNVGTVTDFLFRQNVRAGLEIPLQGFGGTFGVEQDESTGAVPFIAGGIGITPLLAQLSTLDLRRLRLYWTINVSDVGLVVDTLERYPGLAGSTEVFFSGVANGREVPTRQKEDLEHVEIMGAKVVKRRIAEIDLPRDLAETWYLCTGPALRKDLLRWLEGKRCIFEDFDY